MATRETWPHRDTSGEPTWDERILALLPPSYDESQIVENLKLTPTERLQKLQALVNAVEAMRARA